MNRVMLVALLSAAPALGVVEASNEPAARDAIAGFEARASDWKARVEALVGLARGGEDTLPVLTEGLKKGSPAVREFAAQALEILADPRARPALLEALADPSPRVRAGVVRALSALGPLDLAMEPFRKLLEGDPERSVRHAAAWALERDDGSSAAAVAREALRGYELSRMDSARLHEPAPEFSLVDASGKPHRLADLRGKKAVVLKFYNEPL